MIEALAISRPQRWDQPFGEDVMSDAEVEYVLQLEPFQSIDAGQFPPSLQLRDIIRNDARIRRFQRGDIVVRQGDYGNSVFVIISGSVRAVLDEHNKGGLGRRASRFKRSLFSALGQLWGNANMPEVRDVATYQGGGELSLRGDSTSARTFLKNVDSIVSSRETWQMTAGQAFGEIAALSRAPRTVSVFADDDVVLLEMRWQGLRELRRYDKGFREHIDGLYRERGRRRSLESSPLFKHLPEPVLEKLAEGALFESYGGFDWFASYKRVAGEGAEEVMRHEPVIAEQGAYLDGLILVLSGFARISEKLDHGERTLGYLSTNDHFGLEEILSHREHGTDLCLGRSLRAIGYVDVLRVPTALVEEHLLPNLPGRLRPKAESSHGAAWEEPGSGELDQTLIDFFVDNRTINGTQTMLIDNDRCVGCDDCVRACAAAHNNNPRFVRHGKTHGNIQVTNACMHCVDPVCLIGCPTGAIARDPVDGRVMVDDTICIGCGTCANSCPYNNIQLVEIRNADGGFIVDSETNQPIVKATKCDLCFGQLGGPACERACPHDALIRIDMRDRDRLAAWVNRA